MATIINQLVTTGSGPDQDPSLTHEALADAVRRYEEAERFHQVEAEKYKEARRAFYGVHFPEPDRRERRHQVRVHSASLRQQEPVGVRFPPLQPDSKTDIAYLYSNG